MQSTGLYEFENFLMTFDNTSGLEPLPLNTVPAPPSGSNVFAGLVLDQTLPAPLWRQLYSQIDALINSGRIAQGDSLPAERDLAEALGVSRVTVKRCYDELRQARRLAGRGRAGSVVQPPPAPHVAPTLGRLKGFTEEMREMGMVASSRLLVREIGSNRAVASIFGLPSGAPLLHIERVRMGDGTPMTRELAWYDLSLAPKLTEWDGEGSAYAWLREQCGLALAGAEQSVEAVLSSPAEMTAFGFDTPQPCLLFKRRTHVAQGALVEYVEGTFRGDAYVYRLPLTV